MAETKTAQPDVLASIESHTPQSLHPILEAAYTYRKQLAIAVCAILVVTAAYAGYTSYAAKAVASAQQELGMILLGSEGQELISKLEALLPQVPSDVKPAVIIETAKACMDNGDYAKAEANWLALAGLTSGEMNFMVRLGKVKAMTLGGKNAEALTEMKALAAEAASAYVVPVNRQLAETAEAAGDTETALAAYKKLNESNVNDKPFIEFKIFQLEAK